MPRLPSIALKGVLAALLVTSAGGLSGCDRPQSQASSGAARALTDEQAKVLLAALAEAPSHGFRPGAFGEQGLAERLKTHDAGARVHLRAAALAYARALHGRAIPARAFDANWGVLGAQAGWSPDRLSEALASGETTEVKLPRPMQVMLSYMTAFARADGRIAFRPDV